MPLYRVRWEIDIDATTAEDAAIKALEIQRDPSSTATIFSVTCYNHNRSIVQHIDLEAYNEGG